MNLSKASSVTGDRIVSGKNLTSQAPLALSWQTVMSEGQVITGGTQEQSVLNEAPGSLPALQFAFMNVTLSTWIQVSDGLFFASKLARLELFPFWIFKLVN
jgi:hypothetical protein